MRKHAIPISLVFLTSITLLSLSPSFASKAHNKPLTPETEREAHAIGNWWYDQINPSVAFSDYSNLFLVVWEDHYWNFGNIWDIYGRMVNLEGDPVGSQFVIAFDNTHHYLRPDVAYNDIDHEFLVVYEREWEPGDNDIHVQRVSSTGDLIGTPKVIIASDLDETHPAIAYNHNDNEYLVVWQQYVGNPEIGAYDIYFTRLDHIGTPTGGYVAITATTNSEGPPSVSWTPFELVSYHIVWSDRKGLYPALHGAMVSDSSNFFPLEFYWLTGNAFYHPRIAYSTRHQERVYVFEYKLDSTAPLTDGDVRLDNPLGIFGIWIWQAPYISVNINLDVAYNATTNTYLIPFEYGYSYTDHDIYTILFGPYTSDTTRCCLKVGPSPLSTYVSWEANPAVASSNTAVSLVVWEDGRNSSTTGTDIYGAVVWHTKIRLPDVLR